MEKPVPCIKTMIKKSNEEFVQRMSVGIINDICGVTRLKKIFFWIYSCKNVIWLICREIGGKVFLNKFLLHHSGFTKITSIEVKL